MIALDTETHLFGDGNMAPKLVCISYSTGVLQHRLDGAPDLDGHYVGHHIAYDMVVLMANFPELTPRIFELYEQDQITDSMLREQLIDIARGDYAYFRRNKAEGYSLAAVARRRLRVNLDKETVRLRYGELTNTPCHEWPEAFTKYALDDASYSYNLWLDQERQIEFLADQYRQARAAFWIQLMSVWGLVPDAKAVRALEAALSARREEFAQTLRHSGIMRRDGTRDMKAAFAHMTRASNGAPALTEPNKDGKGGGSVCLDREACERTGDDVMLAYAGYAQLNALLNKDVEALKTNIIHSYFELAETGRSISKRPNIYNFPKKFGIRECFVSRTGAYIVGDYKGLELCTLAQVCLDILGCSTIAEEMNRGEDPHMVIAAEILDQSLAWCVANKETDLVFNARQCGKIVNFGKPGGLGAEALVHFAKQNYETDISLARAKELSAIWDNKRPEMKKYFAKIHSAISTFGKIEQLYSGRIRGKLGFTDACNTMFQGLGSDIFKAAGFNLAKWCYLESGARTVNAPHDEFVIETSDWRTHLPQVKKIMIDSARPWLPDVKIDVEIFAMSRYSKTKDYVIS